MNVEECFDTCIIGWHLKVLLPLLLLVLVVVVVLVSSPRSDADMLALMYT